MKKKKDTPMDTKTKSLEAAKRPNRTGVAKNFFIDDDLSKALDKFVGDQELEPTEKSVFTAALKMYLESKGYWSSRRKTQE